MREREADHLRLLAFALSAPSFPQGREGALSRPSGRGYPFSGGAKRLDERRDCVSGRRSAAEFHPSALELAQEALEEPPVALLVMEHVDRHVLGHVVDAVTEAR